MFAKLECLIIVLVSFWFVGRCELQFRSHSYRLILKRHCFALVIKRSHTMCMLYGHRSKEHIPFI